MPFIPAVAIAAGAAATASRVVQGIQTAEAADLKEAEATRAKDASAELLEGAEESGVSAFGRGQSALDKAQASTVDATRRGGASISKGFGQQADTLQGLLTSARGQRSRVDEFLETGFKEDPGFKFRLQQGESAINRKNAASGGRLSGRALGELAQFNQGLASQEANAAFNRASTADQLGITRFGQQANIGTNLANTYGQGGTTLAQFGLQGAQQQSVNAGRTAQNQQALAQFGQQSAQVQAQNEQGLIAHAGEKAAAFANMAGEQGQLFEKIGSSALSSSGGGSGGGGGGTGNIPIE